MFDPFCEYNLKTKMLLERGVQVGDVLICDEGARPTPHQHTKKLHVRVSYNCIIDGTGPRFFIHGYHSGLVAYVPDFVRDSDNTKVIEPGTTFRVVTRNPQSVVLQQVENHDE